MGRKPNPTCLYCAKNYRTEDKALEKHLECYIGHNCRIKRGRLRNKSQVNAKRRQNSGRKKGITTIEPRLNSDLVDESDSDIFDEPEF